MPWIWVCGRMSHSRNSTRTWPPPRICTLPVTSACAPVGFQFWKLGAPAAVAPAWMKAACWISRNSPLRARSALITAGHVVAKLRRGAVRAAKVGHGDRDRLGPRAVDVDDGGLAAAAGGRGRRGLGKNGNGRGGKQASGGGHHAGGGGDQAAAADGRIRDMDHAVVVPLLGGFVQRGRDVRRRCLTGSCRIRMVMG